MREPKLDAIIADLPCVNKLEKAMDTLQDSNSQLMWNSHSGRIGAKIRIAYLQQGLSTLLRPVFTRAL